MVPCAEGEGSCFGGVSGNELHFTCKDHSKILSKIQVPGVFFPHGPVVAVRNTPTLNCCKRVCSQRCQGLRSEEATWSVEVVHVFSLYLDFNICLMPSAHMSPKT